MERLLLFSRRQSIHQLLLPNLALNEQHQLGRLRRLRPHVHKAELHPVESLQPSQTCSGSHSWKLFVYLACSILSNLNTSGAGCSGHQCTSWQPWLVQSSDFLIVTAVLCIDDSMFPVWPSNSQPATIPNELDNSKSSPMLNMNNTPTISTGSYCPGVRGRSDVTFLLLSFFNRWVHQSTKKDDDLRCCWVLVGVVLSN